jgi:hypothetical protein
LGGPFFKDYGDSLKGLGGWKDGDNVWTNYALHPMQGSVSGYLFLFNDAEGSAAEFGRSREYWRSRLKAMGFAAIYSTQFELGPISEASIGNVGKVRGTMGLVDLIVTPLGGFGWMLAEDALDRFVVRRLEQKYRKRGLIRVFRVLLNPTRSFANLMRLRLPWYRPGRELNKPPERDLSSPPAQTPVFSPEGPQGGDASILEAVNLLVLLPA